jgi:hypothetical protein
MDRAFGPAAVGPGSDRAPGAATESDGWAGVPIAKRGSYGEPKQPYLDSG